MLNEMDRIILERLLKAKEPVSGKDLAGLCNAAVNTVRKEIDLINEEISAHGLLIRSKVALGYYMEITDQELAGSYTDNLLYHLRRTRRAGLIYSPRAYYLTRRLLSTDHGISIESLCQELYCSKSAINRDLKQVREILASYDLTLENKRGGDGLRVSGSEWSIRQSLIYQHKVYQIIERQDWPQEGEFKAQLFMQYGADYDRTVRQQCAACLKRWPQFTLPLMHFPKIIHNVQLSLSRARHRSKLTFTPEQVQRAKGTPEYEMAFELHTLLMHHAGETPQEADVLSTAMLLLSYESQNNWLEQRGGAQIYHETIRELMDCLSPLCPPDFFDAVFIQDFSCYLFTLENRAAFHVYPDPEHIGSIRHSGLRSADLCLQFARFYEQRNQTCLAWEDTLKAFYCFNRLVKQKRGPSPLGKNLLVISQRGIDVARAAALSVKMAYERSVGLVTPCDYPEHFEDRGRYDLILTEGPSIPLREYGLPIIASEFGPGLNTIPELDHYLRMANQEEAQKILPSDHLHLIHLTCKEDVFAAAACCLEEHGLPASDVRDHLRENDTLIDLCRGNGLVFLPVLLENAAEGWLHLLISDTPLDWNEESAQVFVCYTRTSDPRENEILWNILTKLMELDQDGIARLSWGDQQALSDLLY